GARRRHFLRAEAVAEPAHDDADEEADRFRLVEAGDDMRIDAQIHGRIGQRLIDIDDLLPEGAAENRAIALVDDAEPGRTDLAIAAAGDDARAGPEARRLGRGRRDMADHRAGLDRLGKDVVAHV